MKNKPPILCELEKNKLIGGQPHFVDTFNWIVDLLDALTKGAYEVKMVDVVTEVKYDRSTHKQTVKKQKIAAIVRKEQPKESDVFEAVPLTDEGY